MKIYKINSLTTTLFIFLLIGFVMLLPIILIETLWNSTIGKAFTGINIDFWQGLILWLIFLVILNILGVFKFEFAVETKDSFEKELLKKKLEGIANLVSKTEEKVESENKTQKDTEET